MKFEFCGNLDCPDWILAQLFAASKLELSRFEYICESVKEAIIMEGKFDEETFFKALDLDEEKFDIDDARCCFAAINFIVTNTCLYETANNLLEAELEQLGLPIEHTKIICKIIEENFSTIRDHL